MEFIFKYFSIHFSIIYVGIVCRYKTYGVSRLVAKWCRRKRSIVSRLGSCSTLGGKKTPNQQHSFRLWLLSYLDRSAGHLYLCKKVNFCGNGYVT